MSDAPAARRVAVVGAGWAGLSAAVELTRLGIGAVLFDTAREPGGRARNVEHAGLALDNGQHILIGAYTQTLGLMRTVGADPDELLMRLPLALLDPVGKGLRLTSGNPVVAFVRAVLALRDWPLADRLKLLREAALWGLKGFACGPGDTVADLCCRLPVRARAQFVDPLCVAALNTPPDQASATVFLRVLRDALFSGSGSADLLLPRVPLGDLLPGPALRWLVARGCTVRLGRRVMALQPGAQGGWQVDGEAFDAVILACTAAEAARLAAPHASRWAQAAAALPYEPIVTVLLECPGASLVHPMVSLPDGPAQFAFDLGAIGHPPGRFSFVISGAGHWVDQGRQATSSAVLEQAVRSFPAHTWPQVPKLLSCIVEHRATFRCVSNLDRPPSVIAPGLVAAGDYISGPYPATLEGAVRAGLSAAQELHKVITMR